MRTFSENINLFVRDVERGRKKKSKYMSSLSVVFRDGYKYCLVFTDNVRRLCLYCKDIHTKDVNFTHKKPKTLNIVVFKTLYMFDKCQNEIYSSKNNDFIIKIKVPLPMAYVTLTEIGYSVQALYFS